MTQKEKAKKTRKSESREKNRLRRRAELFIPLINKDPAESGWGRTITARQPEGKSLPRYKRNKAAGESNRNAVM